MSQTISVPVYTQVAGIEGSGAYLVTDRNPSFKTRGAANVNESFCLGLGPELQGRLPFKVPGLLDKIKAGLPGFPFRLAPANPQDGSELESSRYVREEGWDLSQLTSRGRNDIRRAHLGLGNGITIVEVRGNQMNSTSLLARDEPRPVVVNSRGVKVPPRWPDGKVVLQAVGDGYSGTSNDARWSASLSLEGDQPGPVVEGLFRAGKEDLMKMLNARYWKQDPEGILAYADALMAIRSQVESDPGLRNRILAADRSRPWMLSSKGLVQE